MTFHVRDGDLVGFVTDDGHSGVAYCERLPAGGARFAWELLDVPRNPYAVVTEIQTQNYPAETEPPAARFPESAADGS